MSGNEYGQAPRGSDLSVLGSLDYRLASWDFELGGGWAYTNLSGKNAAGNDISLGTRAGFLSLSPRYRIGERWQLGPVLSASFGTDTGYGPEVTSPVGNWLGGLRAAYEFPIGRFAVRAFQEISTDLSIGDRQFAVAKLGIQFGLPVGGSRAVEASDVVRAAAAAPLRNEIKVVLDPSKVFFRTNSARLKPEVQRILQSVGASEASAIDITGHADRRGNFEYNRKLALKRAESVRQALLEGGVSPELMKAQSFGYLQPADPRPTPQAWARNRRVELCFHDVSQPEALLKKLEPLRLINPEVD